MYISIEWQKCVCQIRVSKDQEEVEEHKGFTSERNNNKTDIYVYNS